MLKYLLLIITYTIAFANLQDSNCINISKKLNQYLVNRSYDASIELFNEDMKSIYTSELLSKLWKKNIDKYGSYLKSDFVNKSIFNGYITFEFRLKFEKSEVIEKIVFVEKDSTNKIAGLYFNQIQVDNSHEIPSYINTKLFREIDTFFFSDKKIKCKIDIPNDVSNASVVIIISGSGPNDADGTIGQNKIYRDLAWGLASKGLVVLRFEKRTRTYGRAFTKDEAKNFTIKEEYIDDGMKSIDFIKTFPEVDTNYIFLLGHSLGGTVISEIAKHKVGVAGLIHLACGYRNLEEIIINQLEYLHTLDSFNVNSEYLKSAKQQYNYQTKYLDENSPSDSLLMNLNAKYWLSLKKIDYKNNLLDFNKRIYFGFGSKDYQVTQIENDGFRTLLQGKRNVSFKTYDGLNHLFMKQEGVPSPQSYNIKSFVSSELIDDLHSWIFKE